MTVYQPLQSNLRSLQINVQGPGVAVRHISDCQLNNAEQGLFHYCSAVCLAEMRTSTGPQMAAVGTTLTLTMGAKSAYPKALRQVPPTCLIKQADPEPCLLMTDQGLSLAAHTGWLFEHKMPPRAHRGVRVQPLSSCSICVPVHEKVNGLHCLFTTVNSDNASCAAQSLAKAARHKHGHLHFEAVLLPCGCDKHRLGKVSMTEQVAA